MSPKTEISDIRREELTRAAMKCIADKGYNRVTLDDVTKEAGLSKGIASYYFKNREELLVSVIQMIWDDLVDLTKKVWDIPEKLEKDEELYNGVKKHFTTQKFDIITIMKEGVKFLLLWIDKNSHVVKVILEFYCQVPRNPMITELNINMHKHIRNISAILIQEGIKRGIFKKRNPQLTAYVLVSTIIGLALNQVIYEREFDNKKLEKDINDMVFDYLMA